MTEQNKTDLPKDKVDHKDNQKNPNQRHDQSGALKDKQDKTKDDHLNRNK